MVHAFFSVPKPPTTAHDPLPNVPPCCHCPRCQGQGTRMKSDLPKVLVPVLGRPMVRYVLDALRVAGVEDIILVVGYRAHLVRAELADEPGLRFVEQTEQLGTGHAVMVCRESLAGHDGPVLILTGDSPLTQASSVPRNCLPRSLKTGPPAFWARRTPTIRPG